MTWPAQHLQSCSSHEQNNLPGNVFLWYEGGMWSSECYSSPVMSISSSITASRPKNKPNWKWQQRKSRYTSWQMCSIHSLLLGAWHWIIELRCRLLLCSASMCARVPSHRRCADLKRNQKKRTSREVRHMVEVCFALQSDAPIKVYFLNI